MFEQHEERVHMGLIHAENYPVKRAGGELENGVQEIEAGLGVTYVHIQHGQMRLWVGHRQPNRLLHTARRDRQLRWKGTEFTCRNKGLTVNGTGA